MTLIKPNLRKDYVTASRASGSTITGVGDRTWLDGASGAIACNIGHGHPAVLAALQRQFGQVSFLYRTQFTNEPSERLASRLTDRLGYADAFFVNSGSEAIETAMRAAVQYWREKNKPDKTRLLSRRVSYHGSTIGALGISGHWPRRRASGVLPGGEPSLPTPYCFRCPLGRTPDTCHLSCATAVEDEILMHGADRVAAIVLEPIVGASGAAIVPPAGYLKKIREICDRHEVLLIADEVLTGLGRTGKWLALEHGDIKADITCLGKGLNGGYAPISAVLVNEQVYKAMRDGSGTFPLGHTHSNHPLTAAVANAVLDVLEDENLIVRAALVGFRLGEMLKRLAADHPIIGDVRGIGMLWGLELVVPGEGKNLHPAEMKIADRVVSEAFGLGLIVYPVTGFVRGVAGDGILVAPPLNISEEQLDDTVLLLGAALSRVEKYLHRNTEIRDAT